jgi:hypothetical protein
MKVGDTVVVRIEAAEEEMNAKLLLQYSFRIYRIVEKPNNFCVKLVNIATQKPTSGFINVSRLKKFITRCVPGFISGEGEVARIKAERENGGEKEYLVDWEGYDKRSSGQKGKMER